MEPTVSSLRDAYLDLLQRSLLGQTVGPATLLQPLNPQPVPQGRRARLAEAISPRPRGILAEPAEFDLSKNVVGDVSVWFLPPWAMTMIGPVRMANIRSCLVDVIENDVPGDVIETGVWRGGATIFMRGILRAYGVTDRKVYVADSFEGLPPPDLENYPADAGLDLHLWPGLAVGVDDVRANFDRYGLLDDQVEFVKGWFRDTLPGLRGHTWSVVRLDGDLYESTMDSLTNLYDGLSVGGWLIVDDYEIPACAQAVTDFRAAHGITDEIVELDWTGICWKKSASG